MRIDNCLLPLLLILVVSAGCKKKFDPPPIQNGLSALVVDGFLNNSPDTTFIHLGRSEKLADTLPAIQENGAQLFVEDPGGNIVYSFQQLNDSGTYIIPGMNLDIFAKYKLRIITSNGKQYLSDEVPVLKTPAIDSITFTKTGKGLDIHANTHDPLKNTRYYRWEYTETWQYHVTYFSELIFENGLLSERPRSRYVYQCWRTQPSTQLLLGSTERLSEDLIYHYILRQIDQDAIELSMKYYIFLRQYAVTKQAYEYMEGLKKMTEQTGTIFDAQPSEINGNIHAVGNSTEPVLGYLTISTMETKERYITNEEVQPWNYKPNCATVLIPVEDIQSTFIDHHVVPLYKKGGPFNLLGVYATTLTCGDCTALGGITTKPGFWH